MALHRQRRRLVALAGLGIGLLVAALGLGQGLDNDLRTLRDGVRNQAASGEIAIVEIDARSIDTFDQWPWPRSQHADAIAALRGAGAETIAFDVDFSTYSQPREDARLARALDTAGGTVILPTLRQYTGANGTHSIDSLPVAEFREHAALASVTYEPDRDGKIRRAPFGAVTEGTPRPSLAAMVAGVNASTDTIFPIDYAIDPATIPHHSFVDLVTGRVPAAALAGKRVLIGATAIELQDRHAVPRYGVIPGVVIHALAAETLLRGIPRQYGPEPGLLLALLAFAGFGVSKRRGFAVGSLAAGALTLLLLPLVTEQFLFVSFKIVPALAALFVAALLGGALAIGHSFVLRVLHNIETGLPNLVALQLSRARTADTMIALAHIHGFAQLASQLGRERTAELVQRIAERLALVSEGMPIYRTDESALAWPVAAQSEAEVEDRFSAADALMRLPVQCGGRPVDVTLHFGVASAAGAPVEQLVADAGLAATRAAKHGLRWERFVANADSDADWRLSLLGELDAAIESGDLWVAYQPKFDVARKTIVGAEALVRWQHPTRGAIRPDHFIPLAEESGRIGKLTQFVLERALADFATLNSDATVSVNIAANLLNDAGLVATVARALEATGVAPVRLILEVTESAAMTDPETSIATLNALCGLGVKLSIDDYGTGQSTLTYLKRLPAYELKIDQSFVRTLTENRSDAILVSSTINLAHELGLRVVAEGVEDQACFDRLSAMGCDLIQGYFTGRPAPFAAFGALVERDPARLAA